MKENFGEYKTFASSAKDVGFDKDERKLVGMEPALVLEGTSEELKKKVTPKALVSFFKFLYGDDKVDPRQILEIGNFLYDYRPDQRGSFLLHENEKDSRLLLLGCRMLENAFYEGKLTALPKERAAALAFTSNVFAKIFENPLSNSMVGFSDEKLIKFIAEVKEYEQKTLFPEAEPDSYKKPVDQVLEKLKIEISAELEKAETIAKSTDWRNYFNDLAEQLNIAYEVFINAGEHDFILRDWRVVIGWLKDWRQLQLIYNKNAVEMREAFEKGTDSPDTQIYYCSLKSVLLDVERGIAKKTGILNDDLNNRLFNIYLNSEGLYKSYLEKISKKSTNDRVEKPKVVKGFDELAEIKAKESLPEALKTIGLLFSENMKGLGVLSQYTEHYRNISRMLSRRDFIRSSDFFFTGAYKRMSQKSGHPASLPYLVKSCLITEDILSCWRGGMRSEGERKLATLQEPYNFQALGTTTHSFLETGSKHYAGDGFVDYDAGPAYANLHFIPEELPFTVWASKYLRSKNKNERILR